MRAGISAFVEFGFYVVTVEPCVLRQRGVRGGGEAGVAFLLIVALGGDGT